MMFADYFIYLENEKDILFDAELTPKHFNVKEGDEFVVKIINNRIMMMKKDKNDSGT